MDTRILIVDDIDDWREKKVASPLRRQGYTVQCASSHSAALGLLCGPPAFDLSIINIILEGEVEPGWKLDWTTLLREAAKVGTSVIVLTAMKDVDVLKTAYEKFGVASVLFKQDLVEGELEEKVRQILEHRHSPTIPTKNEKGDKYMDWNTITALAVSTVSPYAVAFAMSTAAEAGKETVKIASEGIKGLAQKAWQWLERTVSESDSESDKEVWENFNRKPESYKDALDGVILRLCPNEDVVLRGYMEGVVQAVEQREGAQIYALLEKKFMRGDIEEIASRITSEWKDKVSVNYDKTELANWVIRYSQTRNLLSELIAAMLIVNPSVVLE